MDGQTKIIDWYRMAYPTDEWAIDGLNKAATFQDAYECLHTGFNFYTFLGVSDSIVRERVFDALSELMDCDYSVIYDQWLNRSKKPLGYKVVTDMKGLRF